ncbi:helix-turn-helix domain-containing protein [Saccharopolyspora phatthalungensis]|uniref:Transcriptional regulator with XRE-family HTH domain n=1 Tax=Saccharopolyspora phatthalungensis TaxID=664693 RepID=A0A840Q756_9PSEU|nr:helix-turn-helix transcriptional regulator [Saccharopolyspora phatthalungensis]MBB5152643.1 transcriptional regulator with XRE-family HTH domain [Saccharopolyspora phatthalungensis]
MAERGDPSALRWLIGVELARHRKDAGQTLAEAAKAIGCSTSLVGHFEKGMYFPQPEQIARLLEFYGAPAWDVDRLTSLCGRADQRSWLAPWIDVIPDWLRTFVGLEGLAESEFAYQPMVLPGLVQTEDYAQALTSASGFVGQNHNERFVSFRIARARRLIESEPLKLHVVVGDSALRLAVGTPEIRLAQYERLIELAQRPNITFQVVRPECGPHDAGGTGQFLVLTFAEARPIAYLEHLDGAIYVQDPDDVRTYTLVSENLQRVALEPAESVEYVQALMSEM